MKNGKSIFLLQPVNLDNQQVAPVLILSENEDSARAFADKMRMQNSMIAKERERNDKIGNKVSMIYFDKEKVSCTTLTEAKDYKIIKKFGDTLQINLIKNNKIYVITLDKPVRF